MISCEEKQFDSYIFWVYNKLYILYIDFAYKAPSSIIYTCNI